MNVVIIGAGIGGLSAGIALQQLGYSVQIYEKFSSFKPLGAGLTIWRNALLGLRELGIAEAALSDSSMHALASLRNWDGAYLSDPNAVSLPLPITEVVRVFPRATVQHSLLDQLAPDTVQLGQALETFTQTDTGITATFNTGHTVNCDLLIGADGIHSKVRQQLHPHSTPVYAGYTAWRAIVPFDQAQCVAGETWGPRKRFGMFPIRHDHMYWYATEAAPANEHAANGEKKHLQQSFADWHAPIQDLLAVTPDSAILRNDVYDIAPLKTWGTGNVTLLGDAAHAMTPNLGQGACQAIESAVVLRNTLRDASNVTQALRAYEAKRIKRTTPMIKQCRQIGKMGQWHNPAGVFLRNTLMQSLPAGLQQKQLLKTLDVAF